MRVWRRMLTLCRYAWRPSNIHVASPSPCHVRTFRSQRKHDQALAYRAAGVVLRLGKNTEPTGSIRDVHFELIALWIQPSTFSRVVDIWMEHY